MVIGNSESGFLHCEWSFDHCCDKTAIDVPFDVAVEQPDSYKISVRLLVGLGDAKLIWVIRLEAEHNVRVRIDHEGIPSHRYSWECVIVRIWPRLLVTTSNGLKVVSMKMEWVLAGVKAIQYYLNNLVLFQNESIGIGSIDPNLRGTLACTKNGI